MEKLLILLDELCEKEENKWFEDALRSRFGPVDAFENFPEFLKYQKNQYKRKGRNFYKSINQSKLHNELVSDYVEMSWYKSINNIERFMLYAFYQMENLLNYYLTISNVYEKLEAQPDYYTHKYAENFIVVPFDSFLKYGKKPLENISIWAKITFWMKDSNSVEWEARNHWNIDNLIKVRNINSHRNSQGNDLQYITNRVKTLSESDASNLGYYINVLRQFLKTINSSIEK